MLNKSCHEIVTFLFGYIYLVFHVFQHTFAGRLANISEYNSEIETLFFFLEIYDLRKPIDVSLHHVGFAT